MWCYDTVSYILSACLSEIAQPRLAIWQGFIQTECTKGWSCYSGKQLFFEEKAKPEMVIYVNTTGILAMEK